MTIPETQPADIFTELYSQPGVSGSCLQVGRAVVRHDMPYSDQRMEDFAARLDHLIASYQGVDRSVWQIFAAFEKYWLLVLCRGEMRLSLLLTPEADAATITSRGTYLLMQVDVAPPAASVSESVPPGEEAISPAQTNGKHPPILRSDIEARLLLLLSRVVGSAQAQRLIAREVRNLGYGEHLTDDQARRLGEEVLEYIPNRSKRGALLSEFFHSLET